MSLLDHYAQHIEQLKQQNNFRQFSANQQVAKHIYIDGQKLLNLSSNDYLGLAVDTHLREEFLSSCTTEDLRLSASSSRLLTGNFAVYERLEHTLTQAFLGRAALLFNSGYHMNIGILPALSDRHTLILADKLIHASIIDGIRLSSAKYLRYRHNDLTHLNELLLQYHDDEQYHRIIIVTESIFSMDGDETDLTALVALKHQFNKTLLYVDDAHAVGVRGEQGLGCAEQHAVIDEVDFLVGTFGKALASVGGYIICDSIIRSYLINQMRPLIFSTALPPLSIAWSEFVFKKMLAMQDQRQQLLQLSQTLHAAIQDKGYQSPSSSHIVPIIVGESHKAIEKASELRQSGFYTMPVRPPTVPQHASRLRICLNALLEHTELDALVQQL